METERSNQLEASQFLLILSPMSTKEIIEASDRKLKAGGCNADSPEKMFPKPGEEELDDF